MRMLFCIVGTLVALNVTEVSAQMVKGQTGGETTWSAKSENACYKCCRRWQARMGWSPSRVEVCTQKCIVGTGRNC
jgi:hypothetical protein